MIVGDNEAEHTFYVHEEVAAEFSDFLKAAIQGGFSEAQDRIVRLPDDDPELFKIFLAFTYTGRVYCTKADDRESPNEDREKGRLADAWMMAERLQSVKFKDAIVDSLIANMLSTGTYPTGTYKGIYAESAGPSGMRKLHVDIAVFSWSNKDLEDADRDEAWQDFFYDVAVRSQAFGIAGRPRQEPWKEASWCRYHDHGDAAPCYKSMFA